MEYNKIIEMLEEIICNELDTKKDYEVVEILNNAISEIKAQV